MSPKAKFLRAGLAAIAAYGCIYAALVEGTGIRGPSSPLAILLASAAFILLLVAIIMFSGAVADLFRHRRKPATKTAKQ